MKLTIALVVAALIITAAVVVSGTPDQTAEAKSVRKVLVVSSTPDLQKNP